MLRHALALVLFGFCASFALLLDEVGDQARPARLVAGADPSAIISVKILVKWDIIASMRGALECLLLTEYGPPAY